MSPVEAEELDPVMYEAMIRYAVRSQREERRAERRAARGRR